MAAVTNDADPNRIAELPVEMQEEVLQHCLPFDQFFVTEKKLRAPIFASSLAEFTFCSKNTLAFSSKPTRQIYSRLLRRYILEESSVIIVNVRDLNSQNIKALINKLSRLRKARDFALSRDGGATRSIKFYHTISQDFPDSPDKLNKFLKAATTDTSGEQLCTEHYVKHCDRDHLLTRVYAQHVGLELEHPSANLSAFMDAVRDHLNAKMKETWRRDSEYLIEESSRSGTPQQIHGTGEETEMDVATGEEEHDEQAGNEGVSYDDMDDEDMSDEEDDDARSVLSEREAYIEEITSG